MVAMVLALMGALCGVLLLSRFPKLGLALDNKASTCSVIIPARNEAERIPALLTSLQSQMAAPLEILVIDDGSTDDTVIVAKALGATVHSVRESEKDSSYTGKTYALEQGAKVAQGELLLFLDADLVLDPTFLARFCAPLASHETRSLQPYHTVPQLYEQFSLLCNALILIGVGSFSLFGKKVTPSGAFGPCFMIRKDDYTAIGGHEQVKGVVLEHFRLGDILTQQGFTHQLYTGKGLASFRMYPEGFGQLWEGWTKGFATGASHSKPLFLMGAILWIGAILTVPTLLLVGGDSLILGSVAGMIIVVHVALIRSHLGSFRWWNLLVLPLHGLFFVTLFTVSFIKIHLLKQVNWRGRKVKVS